jgi:L-serine/L-threonine ammonia-lyase
MAAAYASHQLHTDIDIVVPETTSEYVRSIMTGYGARVIVHGKVWNDANDLALKMAAERGGFLNGLHIAVD